MGSGDLAAFGQIAQQTPTVVFGTHFEFTIDTLPVRDSESSRAQAWCGRICF